MTKNHPFLVFYQKKTRVFEIIQVFIWVFKRYLTVLTGKKVKVAGGKRNIWKSQLPGAGNNPLPEAGMCPTLVA